MSMLIFVLGVLLGVLAGGGICVRYLRREISADIGPQLRRMRLQLETLEAAVNLALMTRYTELSSSPRSSAAVLPPAGTIRGI